MKEKQIKMMMLTRLWWGGRRDKE